MKPATPTCQMKHHTPGDRVSVHVPSPPQEPLEGDGTRPAKPSPNPDDAGLIVGLPVAVTEPGLKPGSLVAELALRCSVLDHCATRVVHGQAIVTSHVLIKTCMN
jgi:hypothetical protein